MVETSYDQLHDLIAKGLAARQYAWEHYEELASREAVYTLYGPHSCFLGAVSPCTSTRKADRKLLKKTRRQSYNVYELDADFRVIRVHGIVKQQHDGVRHIFELNGVTYGCSFRKDCKKFHDQRTLAIKYQDGKPVYYASTTESYIICEFYEYPEEGKRLCTSFMYSKNCVNNYLGLVPDFDAPLGTPGSPVTKSYCEDVPPDLDFSKYFME